MKKVIALIGEAGSGKDAILNRFTMSDKYHGLISHTTRPRRYGECDGINYFYIDDQRFLKLKSEGFFLETSEFNGWHYGTGLGSLVDDKINVGVFNPEGIRSLLKHPEVEVRVVYVRASAKTRLIRQLNREQDPNIEEILRRFKADEADFKDLEFNYTEYVNESYNDLERAVEYLSGGLGQK